MAFNRRSNEYWERRAAEQLSLIEKQSLKHINEIDRVYLDARRRTVEDTKKLYEAYYTKQGWDTTKLKQIAPRGDIRRFRESVEAAGLASRLPDRYGFRMSRLELLEAQMWLEARKAALAHQGIQRAAHRETINTAYNYALYNLSKGTGQVPAFAQIDSKKVTAILDTKFHGKNYSQRVWGNSTKLAREIRHELGFAANTGQSYTRTSKKLKDRYNVTRMEAQRLVRTETNHFNTLATTESYKEIGLDQFVYVATLDTRTSEICQRLDQRRFSLDDTENMPPQHPNCRSTQRAWLGAGYEPDQRIMRDPETGENRHIENMSYEQWKELVLD